LPDVATTLNNLGALQYTTNDYAAALVSYTEALPLYRELAAKNPDVYLPDVAMTINNLGNLQENSNDYTAALASFTEALTQYHELAVKNPDVYLPNVALTLNNLGNLQYNTNDYAAALTSYTEALTILRELATKNPDVYLPYVAQTLINMAVWYYKAPQANQQQSLALVTEALHIALPLMKKVPNVQRDIDSAYNLLRAWGIEPEEFVKHVETSGTSGGE
jgi:tetratricopeptide (TPR) repeat protein